MSLKFLKSKLPLKLCLACLNQLPSPLLLAQREPRNTKRLKPLLWRRAKGNSRELISSSKFSHQVFSPKRGLLRFVNNQLRKPNSIEITLFINVILQKLSLYLNLLN